jgi:hypothetical protein
MVRVEHQRSVTDQQFRTNAWRLVQLVQNAIASGYTSHVNAVVPSLDTRRKREWLNRCAKARSFTAGLLHDDEMRLQWLKHSLADIDEKALKLTAKDVAAAWLKSDDVHVAASLAKACGAFGYETEREAWDAFRKFGPE